MEIELSAAKAWREAANPCASDVKQAAMEMVADNIIRRLEDSVRVTFEYEVAKILMDTDGDPATAELLLDQVKGIAREQSPQALERVRAQIAGFR